MYENTSLAAKQTGTKIKKGNRLIWISRSSRHDTIAYSIYV